MKLYLPDYENCIADLPGSILEKFGIVGWAGTAIIHRLIRMSRYIQIRRAGQSNRRQIIRLPGFTVGMRA